MKVGFVLLVLIVSQCLSAMEKNDIMCLSNDSCSMLLAIAARIHPYSYLNQHKKVVIQEVVIPKKDMIVKDECMEEECSICLDEITANSQKILPCNHSFHAECIDRWLQRESRTCPYCRKEVPEYCFPHWSSGCRVFNRWREYLNNYLFRWCLVRV